MLENIGVNHFIRSNGQSFHPKGYQPSELTRPLFGVKWVLPAKPGTASLTIWRLYCTDAVILRPCMNRISRFGMIPIYYIRIHWVDSGGQMLALHAHPWSEHKLSSSWAVRTTVKWVQDPRYNPKHAPLQCGFAKKSPNFKILPCDLDRTAGYDLQDFSWPWQLGSGRWKIGVQPTLTLTHPGPLWH